MHHHHGKLGMTEECSNEQRSVWCTKDIEPSNCFFFETNSQCVAEWAFLLSFWSIVLESLCSCLDLDSYLSYSTNIKKFSKIISWHNISPPLSHCQILRPLMPLHRLASRVNSKTRGMFYMEYAISQRSEESNKEGNDWASVLKPQWSDGREPLVEKDSCIAVFVYFSCSFSLYNRTFVSSVFPFRRSSINGKRKHHRKV